MKKLKIPKYTRVLLILTAANLAILFFRNFIVGDHFFNFLLSNLLSGIIPFIIAVAIRYFNRRLSNFFFIVASLVWLLFYPNSPYMISDLIHPHQDPNDATSESLIIYDTLIVFSIAMLSVFYGFVSLKIMFNLFRSRFGNKFAHTAIFISLCLSCLGFYMGRELVSEIKAGNGYLYSWEIFLEPGFIIKTVWQNLFPIQDHLPVYYMMALFGFVQYQLLIMMKDVSDFEAAEIVTKKNPVLQTKTSNI
ncbi:MAG TPA: DUF1361 domain-containing protein [Parafilimonas sp.]|nr:DUF1361 domain-containing protein [Parafilimonas sp.]